MPPVPDPSFAEYLAAKESVDDDALHRPTLDAAAQFLASTARASADEPVRVLDVGTGLGSMLRRLLDWGRLPERVSYVGVDLDPSLVAAAADRTATWASERGYAVNRTHEVPSWASELADREPVTVEFGAPEGPDRGGPTPSGGRAADVRATFVAGDGIELAPTLGPADLVVACAVMDIVDAEAALPNLRAAAPDGGLYFPITFDGVTAFEPGADAHPESAILDAFHATMDAEDRAGGSHAGRRLLSTLRESGAGSRVVAGGSDWVVTPPYRSGEATFLHHVVDTVEGAVVEWLADGGEADDALDPSSVRAWATDRHDAVEAGALVYLAHNLDVFARVGTDDDR